MHCSDINSKPQCSFPFFTFSCHLGIMKGWWYSGFTYVAKQRIKLLGLEGNDKFEEICFELWDERACFLDFICMEEMKGISFSQNCVFYRSEKKRGGAMGATSPKHNGVHMIACIEILSNFKKWVRYEWIFFSNFLFVLTLLLLNVEQQLN